MTAQRDTFQTSVKTAEQNLVSNPSAAMDLTRARTIYDAAIATAVTTQDFKNANATYVANKQLAEMLCSGAVSAAKDTLRTNASSDRDSF